MHVRAWPLNTFHVRSKIPRRHEIKYKTKCSSTFIKQTIGFNITGSLPSQTRNSLWERHVSANQSPTQITSKNKL